VAALCIPQTRIRFLDMSGNNAGSFASSSGGADALAAALRDHPTLTYLDLSSNRLDKVAVTAIASGLSDNCVLMELHLDDNGIDPQVGGHCSPGPSWTVRVAAHTAVQILSVQRLQV
jgi:hypothetical protein